MTTSDPTLEALFDKVRALPAERRQAAVEALIEIAEEPYPLSQAELAILGPALERVRKGEFVDEAVVSEVLDKPWR